MWGVRNGADQTASGWVIAATHVLETFFLKNRTSASVLEKLLILKLFVATDFVVSRALFCYNHIKSVCS
jgi:hypothetical protein